MNEKTTKMLSKTSESKIKTTLSPSVKGAGFALILLLLCVPFFGTRGFIQDLIFVFYMLILAQYWNLLAGFSGMVSVGQQAFVGLGAYVLFAGGLLLGVNPIVAIFLAGLVAIMCALPTAFFLFRLKGAYFAIGTWVAAEIYRLSFAQMGQLGGGTGTSLPVSVSIDLVGLETIKSMLGVTTPAARDIELYWLALFLMIATIAGIYFFLKSRWGLALAAIRDQEVAARAIGVDIYKLKLSVYLFAAFGTGVVGALIYLHKTRIAPDAAFSVIDWTAYVIFIVVIGGLGTIEGPIIGVLIFYFLQTYLADFGTWYLILLGSSAIGIMLYMPQGIWGKFSEKYQTQIFPIRRQLVNKDRNLSSETQGKVMLKTELGYLQYRFRNLLLYGKLALNSVYRHFLKKLRRLRF